MPTICQTCGRTFGSCATCRPFVPDDVRRDDGVPEQPLTIRREDAPVAPFAAAEVKREAPSDSTPGCCQ